MAAGRGPFGGVQYPQRFRLSCLCSLGEGIATAWGMDLATDTLVPYLSYVLGFAEGVGLCLWEAVHNILYCVPREGLCLPAFSLRKFRFKPVLSQCPVRTTGCPTYFSREDDGRPFWGGACSMK